MSSETLWRRTITISYTWFVFVFFLNIEASLNLKCG